MNRSRRSAKLVKVFSALVDGPEDGPVGPAADGTFVVRSSTLEGLRAKIGPNPTTYGRPAKIHEDMEPLHLAQRWGCA
jgi:hypothetical protein